MQTNSYWRKTKKEATVETSVRVEMKLGCTKGVDMELQYSFDGNEIYVFKSVSTQTAHL